LSDSHGENCCNRIWILSHPSAGLAPRQHARANARFELNTVRVRDAEGAGGVTCPEPDVTNCGGVTVFMKIAHLAEAFNLPATSHGAHDVTVHLLAACPNRSYLEAHGFVLDRFIAEPLRLEDGFASGRRCPQHDWIGASHAPILPVPKRTASGSCRCRRLPAEQRCSGDGRDGGHYNGKSYSRRFCLTAVSILMPVV
jgi:hypothetical protein